MFVVLPDGRENDCDLGGRISVVSDAVVPRWLRDGSDRRWPYAGPLVLAVAASDPLATRGPVLLYSVTALMGSLAPGFTDCCRRIRSASCGGSAAASRRRNRSRCQIAAVLPRRPASAPEA